MWSWCLLLLGVAQKMLTGSCTLVQEQDPQSVRQQLFTVKIALEESKTEGEKDRWPAGQKSDKFPKYTYSSFSTDINEGRYHNFSVKKKKKKKDAFTLQLNIFHQDMPKLPISCFCLTLLVQLGEHLSRAGVAQWLIAKLLCAYITDLYLLNV